MIVADDVMPLLVAACPSFATEWAGLVSDPIHQSDDGGRLHYLDAGRFARHLVVAWAAGDAVEVHAALALIERMHVHGDQYVQQLATIGYLEGFQSAVERTPGCDVNGLVALLGPESLRRWRGLDEFWSGRSDSVNAVGDQAHER